MTEHFSFDAYDYLILGISIVITFISIWKGFVNSILSLLTWIGSILITIYSWSWFSNFLIVDQLNKINFLNENPINQFIGMIISIPIIFLVTLFLLKKFRRILTDDIDKQFLGKLLDKVFGIFYGFLFSYILFSAVLHLSDELKRYLPSKWEIDIKKTLISNSNILEMIDNANTNIKKTIYNSSDIVK